MGDESPKSDLPEDLRNLGRRLAESRESADSRGFGQGRLNPRQGTALGLAFRVAVELVSALAVGLAIGWLLDKWLETKPWLMLVFIVLGGAAGILNVYRVASGYGYAVGYRKQDEGAERPRDDDQGTGSVG